MKSQCGAHHFGPLRRFFVEYDGKREETHGCLSCNRQITREEKIRYLRTHVEVCKIMREAHAANVNDLRKKLSP